MVTKKTEKEKERDDIKMPIRAIEMVGLIFDSLRCDLDPWERANKAFQEKYGKDHADTPKETVDFIAMLAAFLPGNWVKEFAERFVFVYKQKYGDIDEVDSNGEY